MNHSFKDLYSKLDAILDNLQLGRHFIAGEALYFPEFGHQISSWTGETSLFWLRNQCDFTISEVYSRSDTPPHTIRIRTPAEIDPALRQGRSIQVRQLQRFVGPTDELAYMYFALQKCCQCAIDSVTLFITPPRTRAIQLHTDPCNNVTLQIAGAKEWRLWAKSSLKECTESNIHSKINVTPGSLLHIPPNVPHSVSGCEELSISVGFLFRRPTYSKLFEAWQKTIGSNVEIPLVNDPEVVYAGWKRFLDQLQTWPMKDVVACAHELLGRGKAEPQTKLQQLNQPDKDPAIELLK